MEKKEFLTDEQRRGLIYGSLISAVLSGGAALRSGGNITDAIGRGTMGAAEAFGGGMEGIAKQKHAEIENAKNEEAIRASQESQSLAKKNFNMQAEAHKSSQAVQAATANEMQRKTSEEGLRSNVLQQWVAEQRVPMAPAGQALDPNVVAAVEAGGPSVLAQYILGSQKQVTSTGNTTNIIQGQAAALEKKLEATREEGGAERKTKEGIAEKGNISKEKIGAAQNVSKEKQAETRAGDTKTVKSWPYMDPNTGEGFDEMAPGRVRFSQKAVDKIAKRSGIMRDLGEKPSGTTKVWDPKKKDWVK